MKIVSCWAGRWSTASAADSELILMYTSPGNMTNDFENECLSDVVSVYRFLLFPSPVKCGFMLHTTVLFNSVIDLSPQA